MKRSAVCVAALALLVTTAASAQISPVLQGLMSIRLRVSLNANTSTMVPVDTAVIVRTLLSGLQAHGWRIARDRIDDSLSAHWPTLGIQIEVFEYRDASQPDRPTLYLTRFDYALYDSVKLPRLSNPITARTWDGRSITNVVPGAENVQSQIVGTVQRVIARFNQARGPIGRMGN